MAPATNTFRPHVIIVDGVTGTGKSALLQFIRREYSNAAHVGTKISDRPERADDATWEYRFVEQIPPHFAATTYSSVGNRYAIDTDELSEVVGLGRTYVTTCAHYGVIESLRQRFTVAVVYIYRPLTSNDVRELMEHRGVVNGNAVAQRVEEIERLPDDYAAGISVYDFVLLNVGTVAQFQNQARALLRTCGLIADGAA